MDPTTYKHGDLGDGLWHCSTRITHISSIVFHTYPYSIVPPWYAGFRKSQYIYIYIYIYYIYTLYIYSIYIYYIYILYIYISPFSPHWNSWLLSTSSWQPHLRDPGAHVFRPATKGLNVIGGLKFKDGWLPNGILWDYSDLMGS